MCKYIYLLVIKLHWKLTFAEYFSSLHWCAKLKFYIVWIPGIIVLLLCLFCKLTHTVNLPNLCSFCFGGNSVCLSRPFPTLAMRINFLFDLPYLIIWLFSEAGICFPHTDNNLTNYDSIPGPSQKYSSFLVSIYFPTGWPNSVNFFLSDFFSISSPLAYLSLAW